MSQAIATLVADIVTRTASKTKARNGEAEDPNAQLIGLCDRITAIAARSAAMASDCEDTVEAENALEPTLHKLWKQIDRLASRIAVNLETEDRPVISGEAAAAVARAALALAPKTPSGDLRPGDDAEWLAYVVSEWAADQGATTTTLH